MIVPEQIVTKTLEIVGKWYAKKQEEDVLKQTPEEQRIKPNAARFRCYQRFARQLKIKGKGNRVQFIPSVVARVKAEFH